MKTARISLIIIGMVLSCSTLALGGVPEGSIPPGTYNIGTNGDSISVTVGAPTLVPGPVFDPAPDGQLHRAWEQEVQINGGTIAGGEIVLGMKEVAPPKVRSHSPQPAPNADPPVPDSARKLDVHIDLNVRSWNGTGWTYYWISTHLTFSADETAIGCNTGGSYDGWEVKPPKKKEKAPDFESEPDISGEIHTKDNNGVPRREID